MRNFTIIILIVLSWWQVGIPMDGCADPDSLGDVIASNIRNVDTINGLAIFVAFPEDTISLGSDTLLTWNKQFEDSSGFGPSQIIDNSSFHKHILNLLVNPGLENRFFVLPHSQQWYQNQYDTTEYYISYLKYMNLDVMAGLDSIVDFSNYDVDGDSIVDYIGIVTTVPTLVE